MYDQRFDAVNFGHGAGWYAVVRGVIMRPSFNDRGAAIAYAQGVFEGSRHPEPRRIPLATFSKHWNNGVLVLLDHDYGRSVTNDAEAVVVHCLNALGRQAATTRIVYRDTDGRYDELRHDGLRFTGFAPLNTRDEEEAVRKVVAEGTTS